MTLLTGRNRIYLLLAALALTALLAAGWVTLAGAQEGDNDGQDADTNGAKMMEGHDRDGKAGVPYDGPSGIWVSGNGKASGAPDIAVISLGVESVEDTAAIARARAAAAMNRVTQVLTDAGIASSDIQTRYFSINPRYQGVEIERCDEAEPEGEQEGSTEKSCYTVWESRLIGYEVSNQASVKIRNLSNVGTIIDQVTEAAGDLVRINGINFNIENPQPLQDEARTNAVADMKRKAEMLAELAGVKLGRLVYLNEGAAYAPPEVLYARAESAAFDSAAATVISGGELEFSVAVQGVFLIDDAADSDSENHE